ncbi:MAG: MBL fold metallo-hydrolase [Porticoccaceae bacterium]|nr:MBL fold metallo-hydrolase [Porticoccaceae bacterium]
MPVSYSQPSDDTLEVSVFGPGVGESLCVHLGNNTWVIIDSCINPDSKRAAALEYLEALGVEPSKNVKLVVISHWHDDHIRGMGEIVECCVNAQVVISSALMHEEFMVLKCLFDEKPLPTGMRSGLVELSKTIEILTPRLKEKSDLHPLIFAGPFQNLLVEKNITISSLSPSHASVTQAKMDLAGINRELLRNKISLPKPTANLNAIALWIESPVVNILLGADLEVHSNTQLGWDAVVKSTARVQGKALVIKVPHHGSVTGHCKDVWGQMVEENNPISLLTAYNRSGLPLNTDVQRLKKITNKLYATTSKKIKPPKRGKVVDAFVSGIVKNREVFLTKMGQIQLRVESSGKVEVNLDGAAAKL